MIYGFYSKKYSGLISNVNNGAKIICEAPFVKNSGDIKIEISTNEVDWLGILDTSIDYDVTGEEIVVPSGMRGNSFQFRIEIDIDSGIEDIDQSGNIVWGTHPKNRAGEQVNFYNAETQEREGWAATQNNGMWEVKLPPGYYYLVYDFQQDIDYLNLPSNQYIIVGSGNLANRFGDSIQSEFKKADEVYLTSTFLTFEWSKYLVTDLGTSDETPKRDNSQYSNNVKIGNGRIYKGDAFLEFIGFIIGRI